MHKLLISIVFAATLAGCSSTEEKTEEKPEPVAPKISEKDEPSWYNFGESIPRALDDMPFVYKPTIQQGNVVTQEMINQLKPGMEKRQVRFLLGTPRLVDVFHQERWDYVYTIGVGTRPQEIKRAALYFEADELVRIEGDYRPQPIDPQTQERKEVVVTVPDWNPHEKTYWEKFKSYLWTSPEPDADEH